MSSSSSSSPQSTNINNNKNSNNNINSSNTTSTTNTNYNNNLFTNQLNFFQAKATQQQQPFLLQSSNQIHHNQQQQLNNNQYGTNVNRLKSVFFSSNSNESSPTSPKHMSRFANLENNNLNNNYSNSSSSSINNQPIILPIRNESRVASQYHQLLSPTITSNSNIIINNNSSSSSSSNGNRSRSLSTPRTLNPNSYNKNNNNKNSSSSIGQKKTQNEENLKSIQNINNQSNSLSSSSDHSTTSTMSSPTHSASPPLRDHVSLSSEDHLTRFQSAKALFARMEEESARQRKQMFENNSSNNGMNKFQKFPVSITSAQSSTNNVKTILNNLTFSSSVSSSSNANVNGRRSLNHTVCPNTPLILCNENSEPINHNQSIVPNKRLTMASTNAINNTDDLISYRNYSTTASSNTSSGVGLVSTKRLLFNNTTNTANSVAETKQTSPVKTDRQQTINSSLSSSSLQSSTASTSNTTANKSWSKLGNNGKLGSTSPSKTLNSPLPLINTKPIDGQLDQNKELEEEENIPPNTNATVLCTSSAVVYFNNPTYLPSGSGSASPTYSQYSHSNMSSSNVSLMSKTSPHVDPSKETAVEEGTAHSLPHRSPSPLLTGSNYQTENEKTPTSNLTQTKELNSEHSSSGSSSSQQNHMTRRKLFNEDEEETKSDTSLIPANSHINTSITIPPLPLQARTPPPLPAKPKRSPAMPRQEIRHQDLDPPNNDTVEKKVNNEQHKHQVLEEEEEEPQKNKETEPNTTLTTNLDEDDEYDYFEIPGLPDIDEDMSQIRLGLKGNFK